jgi:hypothetical protein
LFVVDTTDNDQQPRQKKIMERPPQAQSEQQVKEGKVKARPAFRKKSGNGQKSTDAQVLCQPNPTCFDGITDHGTTGTKPPALAKTRKKVSSVLAPSSAATVAGVAASGKTVTPPTVGTATTTTSPRTASTEEESNNSSSNNSNGCDDDKDQEEVPSQVTWSQVDEHIYRLDKQGKLTEVVGSQSMLSQELTFVSTSQVDEDDDDDDDKEEEEGVEATKTTTAAASLIFSQQTEASLPEEYDDDEEEQLGTQVTMGSVLAFSQQTEYEEAEEEEQDGTQVTMGSIFACSQQTESSFAMAQRLGILTQPEDGFKEEDDVEDEVGSSDLLFLSQQSQSQAVPPVAAGTEQPFSLATSPKPALRPSPTPTKSNGPLLSQETTPAHTFSLAKVKREPSNRVSTASRKIPPEALTTTTTTTPLNGDKGIKLSSEIRDTPVRTSECFGSLLNAVQVITSQEEARRQQGQPTPPPTTERQSKRKRSAPPQKHTEKVHVDDSVASSHEEEEEEPGSEENSHDNNSSGSGSNSKRPRKTSHGAKKKQAERNQVQEMAQRAAALAEQTVSNPEMAKKLLLSMALVRENPRLAPSTWPAKDSVVPEGFFWAHYPPLEGGT